MYQVTFKGTPLTVGGEQVKIGDKAPNFTAVKNDLSPLSLSDISGIKIISVVPSLDTGVCSTQTARFYQEVQKNDKLTVLTLSMDLPFAQGRWCQTEKAEQNPRFLVASDYKDRDFSQKYGMMINELGLLARSVFVLDEANVVRYVQYLDEIANEPDYDAALTVASSL